MTSKQFSEAASIFKQQQQKTAKSSIHKRLRSHTKLQKENRRPHHTKSQKRNSRRNIPKKKQEWQISKHSIHLLYLISLSFHIS